MSRDAVEAASPPVAPPGVGAAEWTSWLECTGCGSTIPAGEILAGACPHRRDGDGIDHVLSRKLSGTPDFFPHQGDPHPFVRYRRWLHVWHLARARGFADGDYVALVRDLDARLAGVAGRGLEVLQCRDSRVLAERLAAGVAAVWMKDETGGVAGCHKARHLFATWLELEIADRCRSGRVSSERRRPLAIASCGNAALAAALLARAAGRRLRAFLPAWAPAAVAERLAGLGAEVVLCRRPPGALGDPAYEAFRAACAAGAIAFSCQGPDNALALDGGRTLGYELVAGLVSEGRRIDRLFLQTGGGAFASACLRAFEEAHAHGAPAGALPRFHAVQTAASAPLVRAYDRVMSRLLGRISETAAPPRERERAAELVRAELEPATVDEVLRQAARDRAAAMWPWSEPGRSCAAGILDDETYDWWEIVRGMIASGGYPVVAGEETLLEAREAARRATGRPVSATGAAGFAGAIELSRTKPASLAGESIAAIFTGMDDGGGDAPGTFS